MLDGRHRASPRTRVHPGRPHNNSRCARELVDEPSKGVSAFLELPACETVDPSRQLSSDVRVRKVRDDEVELHVLDLRVPVTAKVSPGTSFAGEGRGWPGGKMREQLRERVQRRELRCDIVPGKLFELCVAILRPEEYESMSHNLCARD